MYYDVQSNAMQLFIFIVSAPFLAICSLLLKCIQILLLLSFIYVIAERIGIINRLVQAWIEYELSRISNGAPISISSVEFQLINLFNMQSTIIVYDGIVHTPKKNDWEWESPLIARVGYTKITANIFTLLDLPIPIKKSLGIQLNTIKDIYTVELKDVQVFVEKRRNVFNFHLLDERLDLPLPRDVLESLSMQNDPQSEGIAPCTSLSKSTSSFGDIFNNSTSIDEEDDGAKKADELVKTIVGAVSTLGRAVNDGGTQALSNALRNQKDGIVSHLKSVQKIVGLNNDNESKEKSASIGIAKESIQVMKQVGKVVEKNVKNMKEQVDALSKPPGFRQDYTILKTSELFRIGFIALKDIRIFTKDIIIVPGSEEKAKPGMTNYEVKYQTMSAMGWSKPIAVEEINIFPTELCPSKDGKDGNDPCMIGQPIENYTNIALERILTEMATSSISGKLLNNAFADVFAWFKIAGNDS